MAGKTKGIACGKCGMRVSRVLRTTVEDGYILRRRECKACRERFTTKESFPGWFPPDMQAGVISVGQLSKMLGMRLPPSD